MSALMEYAQSCVSRAGASENVQAIANMVDRPRQYSISGKPLPMLEPAYLSWTVGILCANAYAAAGPGFDRRFRAERNRQRKIAAKLGLDFSEYDNTDTLPDGNCTRRQLLDAVPLAMDKAKGDGE